MDTIIEILEKAGENAKYQNDSTYIELIESSELPSDIKSTLIDKEATTLERQLDVCPDIVCIVLPAEDEPSEENEEPEKNAEDIRMAINF